jgi:hypothetical protein
MDPKRMNHDARVASPRAPLAAVAVISATALVATTLLPILFATVTLTGLTAAPASASTASMAAQGIPLGLIPDVSSLARFPASALSLKPGLYGDLEGTGTTTQAGVFRIASARAGIVSSPLIREYDPFASYRTVGGFLALPLGSLRLGATLRGASQQDESTDYNRSLRHRNGFWWATIGAGLPLGERGYAEIALSGGEMCATIYSSQSRTYRPDSTVTVSYEECQDAGLSYGVEMRWKAGLRKDCALFGLLSYRFDDQSRKRHDFNDGYHGEWYDVESDEPHETQTLHAAFAVRSKGLGGTRVTAGISAGYTDIDATHHMIQFYQYPTQARVRSFETLATAHLGLSLELKRWLTLFGGLAARYRNDHSVTSSTDSHYNRIDDDQYTRSEVRGGLRLDSGRFYADALVNNSFSTSNPFGALSVGYRF